MFSPTRLDVAGIVAFDDNRVMMKQVDAFNFHRVRRSNLSRANEAISVKSNDKRHLGFVGCVRAEARRKRYTVVHVVIAPMKT